MESHDRDQSQQNRLGGSNRTYLAIRGERIQVRSGCRYPNPLYWVRWDTLPDLKRLGEKGGVQGGWLGFERRRLSSNPLKVQPNQLCREMYNYIPDGGPRGASQTPL